MLGIALSGALLAEDASTVGRVDYRALDGAGRWRYYWQHTYATPMLAARVGYAAALGQWRDWPPEWGQGSAGYGRRAAEQAGRLVAKDSVGAAGAAALGYELRYVRCDRAGTGRRVRHAVLWSVLTLDRAGRARLDAPRLVAPFASEMLRQAWLPPGTRSNAEAARAAVVQLGTRALFNVLREFLPDIRRALRK